MSNTNTAVNTTFTMVRVQGADIAKEMIAGKSSIGWKQFKLEDKEDLDAALNRVWPDWKRESAIYVKDAEKAAHLLTGEKPVKVKKEKKEKVANEKTGSAIEQIHADFTNSVLAKAKAKEVVAEAAASSAERIEADFTKDEPEIVKTSSISEDEEELTELNITVTTEEEAELVDEILAGMN